MILKAQRINLKFYLQTCVLSLLFLALFHGCGKGTSNPSVSSQNSTVVINRTITIQVTSSTGPASNFSVDFACEGRETQTLTNTVNGLNWPLSTSCSLTLVNFSLSDSSRVYTAANAQASVNKDLTTTSLLAYKNSNDNLYVMGVLNKGTLSSACNNFDYASKNECANISVAFSVTNNIQPTLSYGNFIYTLSPNSSSSGPIIQGVTSSLLATAAVNSTFTCSYQSLGLSSSDPNYAPANTPCSSLAGVSLSNPDNKTMRLDWTPNTTQYGSFLFNFISTNSLGSQTSNIYITVREAYSTSNLLASLNPLSAAGCSASLLTSIPCMPPATNSRTSWLNEVTSNYMGTLSLTGTATPWTGVGTIANPYALSFTSANSDSVSLGGVLNGITKFLVSTWVNLTSSSTASSNIISNNSGSTGFTLNQSVQTTGRIQTSTTSHSYQTEVLADMPMGYFTLNDTTRSDLTGLGHHGFTYFSSAGVDSTTQPLANVALTSSYNMTGSVTGMAWGTGVTNGSNGEYRSWINADYNGNPLTPRHSYTMETWAKWTVTSMGVLFSTDACCTGGGTATGFQFYVESGKVKALIDSTSGTANTIFVQTTANFNDNNWHHLVNVYDNSAEKFMIYVDGVAQPLSKVQGCGTVVGTYLNTTGCNNFNSLITDLHYLFIYGRWVDTYADAYGAFTGRLAQASFYLDRAISASRIWAHYSVGKVNGCLSQTQPTNGTWYQIASLFDGTYLSLFLNGSLECKIQGTLSNSSQNLTLGGSPAGSNYWSGKIGDVKVYGTSDNTSPGTSTTVNANFQAQRARFGQ